MPKGNWAEGELGKMTQRQLGKRSQKGNSARLSFCLFAWTQGQKDKPIRQKDNACPGKPRRRVKKEGRIAAGWLVM
jgi:hypothetical protein